MIEGAYICIHIYMHGVQCLLLFNIFFLLCGEMGTIYSYYRKSSTDSSFVGLWL